RRRPRAAAGHRAGRARARLDARRAGLPPRAGRPLALDAHGSRTALRAERGLALRRGRGAHGNRDMPRRASRHLRRPAREARAARAGGARARRGAEPRRGGDRRTLAAPARARAGDAAPELPRYGGGSLKVLVTGGAGFVVEALLG